MESREYGERGEDMTVCKKTYLGLGIVFLLALLLFSQGGLDADWWQWGITIAVSAKCLYLGLSKTGSVRQAKRAKAFRSVSRQLCGKYAVLKTNLPLVLLAGFSAIALFVRFFLGWVIPVWIAGAFAAVLTVSAFYSIGLSRRILEQIDCGDPDIPSE